MKRLRPLLPAASWLLLVAISACSSVEKPTDLRGKVMVSLALVVADVTSVTYEVSGNGLNPTLIGLLTRNTSTATGTIADVPVGTGYVLAVHAFQGSVEVCSGSTLVDVIANQTSTATLLLQCADLTGNVNVGATLPNGDPSDNAFVKISGAGIASPIFVPLGLSGQSVTGQVKRVPSGTARLVEVTTRVGSVSWCTGSKTLDVITGTTADATGITLTCGAGTGGILVNGTLNSFPSIHAVLASPMNASVGDTISLSAIASDADGDTLSFSWSDGSGGTSAFASPGLASSTYQVPPAAAGTNITFTVSVSDGVTTPQTDTVVVQVWGAACTKGQVVISQVYGGGGNSGAVLKRDFIELFNRSTLACTLTGWSLQAATAAAASWPIANTSNFHAIAVGGVTILPGHYYLVGEVAGGGGTVDLPTTDESGSLSLGSAGGRIALVNSMTSLSVACPTAEPSVMDFVGYGASTCSEGGVAAPAPPDSNTSDVRAAQGCTDTDSNGSDFALSAGTPVPRNSATAAHLCP